MGGEGGHAGCDGQAAKGQLRKLSTGQSRHRDAGFTLIETLVALAVLALSAVAILGAAQAHVARVGALEARAAALWAAQNHLTELALGLSPPAQPAAILGYRFRLDVATSATADPGLTRLDIAATDIATGQRLAQLTGFALAPDAGGGA